MTGDIKTFLQILAAIFSITVALFTFYRFYPNIKRKFRRQLLQWLDVDNSNESTMQRVLNTRILRVGCILAEPWFSKREDGSLTGVYPTILSDIANRNSLHVLYLPIRNDTVFEKLNSGELDLVAQLLQTSERSSKATFAACIHNVSMVAIKRSNQSKIESVSDLRRRDVKCAVVTGEIGSQIAPELFDMTEENNRLVTLNTIDVPSVFYLITGSGSVDVAITTRARWIELKERDPEVAKLLEPVTEEALIKIPAGCLLKKDESDFKIWLERETQISRSNVAINQAEKDYIEPYSEAVELL